ncbi:hypothetical protein J437_LFUL004459 [Ladona fulva]|uniref:Endonuclease/exonuclease/phosphatase domain-containing protein n=1 Tax=Ladona fulva TaxID=123851 RepID=A0A8K0JZX6_LADFU|nr:hypothetical protein J437_LFUL004459 [Ladona fulva]
MFQTLHPIGNFCKTKSWDLLVGCDSNSHHSVWGSSDVNPGGESLLKYLMTTELQLLNRRSQPTFRNNVREEVIDITLCTSNIVHKIKGWRVSGETSLYLPAQVQESGRNRSFSDIFAQKHHLVLREKLSPKIICSSYLPYDAPDPPSNRELEDLENFCKTKSCDLLVGCDSNSHHSVWGSSDVNPRGESLLEYLMTTELQLLNRGSQPTFRNNVREEVIDITLCTSNSA